VKGDEQAHHAHKDQSERSRRGRKEEKCANGSLLPISFIGGENAFAQLQNMSHVASRSSQLRANEKGEIDASKQLALAAVRLFRHSDELSKLGPRVPQLYCVGIGQAISGKRDNAFASNASIFRIEARKKGASGRHPCLVVLRLRLDPIDEYLRHPSASFKEDHSRRKLDVHLCLTSR